MSPPSRIPRLGWAIAFAAAAAVLALGWSHLKSIRRPALPPLPVLAATPDFAFTSQAGAPVTRAGLAGKVWIADFIFTRCPGPCPVMTERMSELQRALSNAGDGVRLVSVTVDPEFDKPGVLAKYGERYGADPARWLFLTGEPAAVEKFITKGMLLPLAKNGEGAPIHSQKFVVVDAAGNIRAYRDLNDPELLPKLLQDIDALQRESGS
ncbi:MAG: SCO family protein [Terrimicrobiaceae bacterium]|nr:SCO family protein [Terrimicrobiaceae bacterium]